MYIYIQIKIYYECINIIILNKQTNKQTKKKFKQFSALKSYIENGGSIFYMTGEGGENQYNTNFNYLLEEYGIMTNLGKISM